MRPRGSPGCATGQGSGCLQGIVLGLTGDLPRKQLQDEIKTHGATVSTIIHKRVSFVLCTPDAVKYNTQKVRKAIKHGIPLVKQEFIKACALANGVVDPTPFRVDSNTAVAAAAAVSIPSTSAASPPADSSRPSKPGSLTDAEVDDSTARGTAEAKETVAAGAGDQRKSAAERASGTDASEKRRRQRPRPQKNEGAPAKGTPLQDGGSALGSRSAEDIGGRVCGDDGGGNGDERCAGAAVVKGEAVGEGSKRSKQAKRGRGEGNACIEENERREKRKKKRLSHGVGADAGEGARAEGGGGGGAGGGGRGERPEGVEEGPERSSGDGKGTHEGSEPTEKGKKEKTTTAKKENKKKKKKGK